MSDLTATANQEARLTAKEEVRLTVKEEVLQFAEGLPEDATWDDVDYYVYVRQAIEAGLKDSREGRLVSHAEIRRKFGLDPK